MSVFDILGIPPTASVAEVKAAYRRLSFKAHPDHGGSQSEFNSLHIIYKAALAKAEQPLICEECKGLGAAPKMIGWVVSSIKCKACKGKGEIPRG